MILNKNLYLHKEIKSPGSEIKVVKRVFLILIALNLVDSLK